MSNGTQINIARAEEWLRENQNWLIPVGLVGTIGLLLLLRRPTDGTQPPPTDGGGTEPPPTPPSKVDVLIDPGHGGTDTGYVSAYFYVVKAYEKALTLDFAKRTYSVLTAAGVPTYVTRSADSTVSLSARQQMIARLNPKVVVSLHFGWGKPGTAAISNENSTNMWLAGTLVSRVAPVVGCGDKGTSVYMPSDFNPHYEILRVSGSVPTAVLEIAALNDPYCFLYKYFVWSALQPETSDNYRNRVAAAIADGIISFLRGY